MKVIRSFFFYCTCILSLSITQTTPFVPPKLTVIIVLDQGAFYYLQKLQKNFNYGLKRLLNHSVLYANAHYPHAKPETAPGHAALNTGTYAEYHGFVGNDWFDQETGKSVHCDSDTNLSSALLGDDTNSEAGKSAHFLAVDGISDRFIEKSTPHDPYQVFSLSLKSRSAIAMAGHIKEPFGGVFWYENGKFTSSKAYCNEIPSWVHIFNETHQKSVGDPIIWRPCYPQISAAYNFVKKNSYSFAQEPQFFNRTRKIGETPERKKNPFFWYEASPDAMYDLCELAKICINNNVSKKDPGHTLLWLSFSGLDKLGHMYGPDSYETIDYFYHFDKALEDLIIFLKTKLGKRNFICIFTADHGTSALPEISLSMGIPAKRVFISALEKELNYTIEQKFGIQNIIVSCKPPYVYLDHQILDSLALKEQTAIIDALYSQLKKTEGVFYVWKTKQLQMTPQNEDSIEDHFRKQIFHGRSGDLMFQTAPFYTFTNYKKGSNHGSPYNQDTHVPLMFYGPKYFRHRIIYDHVNILQLVPTLALMFGVELPSASVKQTLPHIFSTDPLFDSF